MAKKDTLLKALAGLTARHSVGDWQYAAENIEEVARLARAIAQTDLPRPKNRKAVRPKLLKTKFPAASEISPISRKFQVFLTEKIGAQSGPNLRDVATSLGMKSELPNNSAALLNAILQYLEKLHEDDRADRIKGAVNYVQQRSPNPSDDYSRWVSLITKK